jgi:hypothetical protein
MRSVLMGLLPPQSRDAKMALDKADRNAVRTSDTERAEIAD